jgi:hypothetical protein
MARRPGKDHAKADASERGRPAPRSDVGRRKYLKNARKLNPRESAEVVVWPTAKTGLESDQDANKNQELNMEPWFGTTLTRETALADFRRNGCPACLDWVADVVLPICRAAVQRSGVQPIAHTESISRPSRSTSPCFPHCA